MLGLAMLLLYCNVLCMIRYDYIYILDIYPAGYIMAKDAALEANSAPSEMFITHH